MRWLACMVRAGGAAKEARVRTEDLAAGDGLARGAEEVVYAQQQVLVDLRRPLVRQHFLERQYLLCNKLRQAPGELDVLQGAQWEVSARRAAPCTAHSHATGTQAHLQGGLGHIFVFRR